MSIDPRVQRAREALEDAYHNLHESDIVRDLLDVVDEQGDYFVDGFMHGVRWAAKQEPSMRAIRETDRALGIGEGDAG